MSKGKERKIKRLRNARIWPSIIFLLISIITMIMALVLFVGLVIGYQMKESNTSAVENAFKCIEYLDKRSSGEEADILKEMETNGTIPEAIFIYDNDGKLIAGHGEETISYDFSGKTAEGAVVMDSPDGNKTTYYIYSDSDTYFNVTDKDGNVSPLLEDLIHAREEVNPLMVLSELGDLRKNIDSMKESAVFSMKFWVGANLSDGRRAYVKCSASVAKEEIEDVVSIAVMMASILFLPVLFLFVNLLLSFSNQRRMTKLIYTDPVTGGNSYLYYENFAEKFLKRKHNGQYAVVDLTIMKYRSYRNFHGTKNAEALLEEVNKDIAKEMRRGEFCAHSGKSSFVILIKCLNRKEGKERVDNIIRKLAARFNQCGIIFHAGIYFYELEKNKAKNENLAAECLSRASAARATLPDENVSQSAVYEDKILEEQIWVHKVEEKMQKALDKEEFKVFIQPKYNPVTEELAGGEALIRWINEEDGFISPGRFIPIFESNGFITRIDDYMISHVAKFQSEWMKEGKKVVPISVNVSRAHFANPNLAEHICSLVDAYEVPHNLIELELTESAFFDDKAALLRTVNKLQEYGFEISMDDFGAGYSSLNSLKDLPLDVLKLDAEFFRGDDGDDRMEIVVSQAIKLAKSLDMKIVAEGVEKKEQVDFLAGQGCDMIQGFYYAKPMPAEEYADRVKGKDETDGSNE